MLHHCGNTRGFKSHFLLIINFSFHTIEFRYRIFYFFLGYSFILLNILPNYELWWNLIIPPINVPIILSTPFEYYLSLIFFLLFIGFILSLPLLYFHLYSFFLSGLYKNESLTLPLIFWIIFTPWIYNFFSQKILVYWLFNLPHDFFYLPTLSSLLSITIKLFLFSYFFMLFPLILKKFISLDLTKLKFLWFFSITLFALFGPPDLLYLIFISFFITLHFFFILLSLCLPSINI